MSRLFSPNVDLRFQVERLRLAVSEDYTEDMWKWLSKKYGNWQLPLPPKPSKEKPGTPFKAPTPERKPNIEYAKDGRWISAGGVVLDSLAPPLTGVWLVHPKGGYGGYEWTFPKGQVEKGETKQQAALREVAEETGFSATILPGGFLGEYKGTSSYTNYFLMLKQEGGSGQHDQETGDVRLWPWVKAMKVVEPKRDKKVLLRAWEILRTLKRGY